MSKNTLYLECYEGITGEMVLGALRELAVSLPFAAAVHPLLTWVRTRALDD